jgi:hypothetical protein
MQTEQGEFFVSVKSSVQYILCYFTTLTQTQDNLSRNTLLTHHAISNQSTSNRLMLQGGVAISFQNPKPTSSRLHLPRTSQPTPPQPTYNPARSNL